MTPNPYESPAAYQSQSQSYRRGFVEGQSGERDAYLLEAGSNIEEYNRGFADGLASLKESPCSS